jgi:DNA-binding CsgD family transcriptional regulator
MRRVLCPRVIGRDEELQTIGTAIDAVGNSLGGCIFVLGEAGVGKSRLAREADRLAQSRGLRVLWGRSVEGGAAVAYRPISEALLSGLRQIGIPDDRPELRPFLKILARLIPDWREAGAEPVEDSLVLLSEAVLRLLRAMGSGHGCLLVLEDLHWADSESLSVLEYLTANAATEPLLVLATSRPEAASPGLALARSLVAHRLGTVLDLARLPPAAVHAMASACLDDAAVPESIERVLNASAEGLPLLVEDLLAEWIGAGALAQDEAGWHVRHVVGPVVPISFGETVHRRLRGVGDESARVLRLAALLGRHFDWTLLPPASGLDEDRVLEHLHTAVDVQVLSAEPSGFWFRHALTQAAVLEELLPAERGRLAARLLGLVEAAHPQLDGEWCELAASLADTAGDHLKAARLLLDSGCKSLAQSALVTAESTLEHAQALAPADAELRTQIDEALLRVLSEAGKHERVFEVGAALLAGLARAGALPLRLAKVHLDIARAALAGSRLTAASRHLAEARRLDGEGVLEARLDAVAAHVAIDELRIDEADRLAQAALEAAERLGQPEVSCEALVVIGRLARFFDLDRAENAFERAHSLATAHGLTVWRSRALHELGTIDMFRECSPRRLLEARALALESGALATVASVDGELSALYVLRFELDRGWDASQRAVEASRRFRLKGVEIAALLFQAEVLAFRRDRAGMESSLADLLAIDHEDGFLRLCAHQFRATLALIEEDRKRAIHELAMAMELGRRLPAAAPGPAFGVWALLRTLANTDGEQTREHVRSSWAMAQPVNRGLLPYAEAVDLGRRGLASEAAQAVAEGDRLLELCPWYLHYARRLIAEAAIQDGWGEPAAWLRAAEPFFEQHGHPAPASACRSLLRKSGGSPSAGRAHPGVPEPFRGQGVTEREMEVLSILAQGLSNKDIGARLYLSPKTIEKHVASLMDKLEVRTRAQLATIAATKSRDGAGRSWGKSPI